MMIDIQHDSPVPIHEQIAGQIMAHIASGGLKAGAELAEYRAFARELLTNPQVVARTYADLEWEGVLKKTASGRVAVTAGAAVICRIRLQDTSRRRLRQVVAQALSSGLPEAEIHKAVEEALAAAQTEPMSPEKLSSAFTTATHATSHRASQGIQVLPGQASGGSSEPDRAAGGDIRPARR
jgi:DNA-binding transcriptional regulator YhcF (GntR family)